MTELEYMNRAENLLQAAEPSCDHINDWSPADIDNRYVGRWPDTKTQG